MTKPIFALVLLCLCVSCKQHTKSKVPANTTVSISDTIIYNKNSPKRITRTIIQGLDDKIWMATWDGIMTFDGLSFTNITQDVSDSRFFSVLEDKKGHFWFASIGAGVFYYGEENLKNFTTNEGLISNNVTNIYEDTKGTIWFGAEGGISTYDGHTFQNFTTDNGLQNNDINIITEDNKGTFWIGTRGEACRYDGKTFTKIIMKDGNTLTNVRHIIKDKKGHMWLGGNDGLWRYDGNTFSKISQNFVGYIYEDHKGNIWTSSQTDDQRIWTLSRYDSSSLMTGYPIATEIKSEKGMFFGILEDDDGYIWVGHLNGVYRYDGKQFTAFKDVQRLVN